MKATAVIGSFFVGIIWCHDERQEGEMAYRVCLFAVGVLCFGMILSGCEKEERAVALAPDPVSAASQTSSPGTTETKVTVRTSGNFVRAQPPFTKLQLVRVDQRTRLQAWLEKKPDEKELRIVSEGLIGVKEVYTVDRDGRKIRTIPHEATIPGPEDVDVMVAIHAYQLTSGGKPIDYVVVN